MELIIVAGKRLVDDMDWMQDEREHHVMQQITQQYLCVERCWKQLLSRGQEWGGLLDNLYPEMKQCQVSIRIRITCVTGSQGVHDTQVQLCVVKSPSKLYFIALHNPSTVNMLYLLYICTCKHRFCVPHWARGLLKQK